MIYFDTSLLVKIYVPEEGSERIVGFIEKNNSSLCLNQVQEFELTNALSLKLFRKEISKIQYEHIKAKLAKDLSLNRIRRVMLDWIEVMNSATLLSQNHTPSIGCRTLDILHVAAATQGKFKYFLTNAPRQMTLAEKAGMITKWPQQNYG
jgi:predicted nucleic acid-binding protein